MRQVVHLGTQGDAMTDETTRDFIALRLVEVTSDNEQRNSIWWLDALHLATALLEGIEVPGVGTLMVGEQPTGEVGDDRYQPWWSTHDNTCVNMRTPAPDDTGVFAPLFRQVTP